MKEPYYCDCEHGGDCTRTTMCAIQTATDDQRGEYEAQIEALETKLKASEERIAVLEEQLAEVAAVEYPGDKSFQ
jgi:septal ring factor EnvC (AmiA/AmiB activator)